MLTKWRMDISTNLFVATVINDEITDERQIVRGKTSFYYSCYILGVNAEYTCTNIISQKIHQTELGLDY